MDSTTSEISSVHRANGSISHRLRTLSLSYQVQKKFIDIGGRHVWLHTIIQLLTNQGTLSKLLNIFGAQSHTYTCVVYNKNGHKVFALLLPRGRICFSKFCILIGLVLLQPKG